MVAIGLGECRLFNCIYLAVDFCKHKVDITEEFEFLLSPGNFFCSASVVWMGKLDGDIETAVYTLSCYGVKMDI